MEISPPTDGEPPKPTPRDGFGGPAEPELARGFTGPGAGGGGARRPVGGGRSQEVSWRGPVPPEAGPGDWPRRAAGCRVAGSPGLRGPVTGGEPQGGAVAGDRFQRRGGAQGVVAGCRSHGADPPRVQARETGPMGVVVRGRGRPPVTGCLGPPYRRPVGGPVPRSPWGCLRFPAGLPQGSIGITALAPAPPRRAGWAPGPASCHRAAPCAQPPRAPWGPAPGNQPPGPSGPPPSPAPAPASRGPIAVPPP